MRVGLSGILLACCIGQAVGQTSTPAVPPGIGAQIRIDAFQTRKRDDDYAIASFAIANDSEKQINSVELTCWIDNDRSRATKVLVWPRPGPIPAHKVQQFSNVNIGMVGNSKAECEVTSVE